MNKCLTAKDTSKMTKRVFRISHVNYVMGGSADILLGEIWVSLRAVSNSIRGSHAQSFLRINKRKRYPRDTTLS